MFVKLPPDPNAIREAVLFQGGVEVERFATVENAEEYAAFTWGMGEPLFWTQDESWDDPKWVNFELAIRVLPKKG